MAKNSDSKIIKVLREWITQTRKDFRSFLKETLFPNSKRTGERGPAFKYPEWLIMFIAVLAVICKCKTYLAIHRMTTQYWDVIAYRLKLAPISERQLRERLKKSAISLESQQRLFFSYFLDWKK